MKLRTGSSTVPLSVKILLISILLCIIIITPTISWISDSLKRLDLAGGRTTLEVVAVSGLGTESPKVYVRNLGPRRLSLGFEKQRNPSLWQVFVGEEYFEVVEVDELGKEDNELEVYEIICLRLEPKEVSGLKRVVVYGPGATLADPPTKAEKTYSSGHGGVKSFFSKVKEKLSSAWSWLKEKGRKLKEKVSGLFSKVKRSISSGYDRFKGRMRADRGLDSAETQEKEKKGEKAETGKKGAKKNSILNKIKRKAGSAWSWCKKHKKDLAI